MARDGAPILGLDRSDPLLDDYRGLRDRDVAALRGGFIVEGQEVLRRLLASPFPVRSILLAEPLWPSVEPLVEGRDVPVYVLPAVELAEVVGFAFHRGVLAVGERGPERAPETALDRSGPAAVVALLGLTNTDNVGASFRNAAAFGAHAVVLDDRCADPLYRRSLRVGMGYPLLIPFARIGSQERVLDRLAAARFSTVALTPDSRALDVATVLREPGRLPQRFAVLIGSEGPGLGSAIIEAADLRIRIPMAEGVDSLNCATAAAVALHALRLARPESFSSELPI